MPIIKDYKIKESVFVIKNTLESVYNYYYGSFPSNIEKSIIELLKILDDEIEKDRDIKNDIAKFELFERIKYEDK